MNFNLTVSFTNQQLEVIFATGSMVVLGKTNGGGMPNVAWLVFQPFMVNSISWDESYGIYASTAQIVNGASLTQLSAVPIPAAISKLYALQANATITGPTSGGVAGAYGIVNEYSVLPYLTAGLFQNANVNGTYVQNNAVFAQPLLLHSTAIMAPSNDVYIWLQSQVRGNTVVSYITSPVTKLRFGAAVNDMSVIYNSATGLFVPSSGASNFGFSAESAAGVASNASEHIEHILPAL